MIQSFVILLNNSVLLFCKVKGKVRIKIEEGNEGEIHKKLIQWSIHNSFHCAWFSLECVIGLMIKHNILLLQYDIPLRKHCQFAPRNFESSLLVMSTSLKSLVGLHFFCLYRLFKKQFILLKFVAIQLFIEGDLSDKVEITAAVHQEDVATASVLKGIQNSCAFNSSQIFGIC